MTEFLTLLIIFFLVGMLWHKALIRLAQMDQREGWKNECPPHQWESVYRDVGTQVDIAKVFDGLKCTKCKQRPGEIKTITNWFDGPVSPG